MLYSVRMRAAQGGDHASGGRHISGAERLVSEADLETVACQMLARARTHSRGTADFIQVTVEEIQPDAVLTVPLLPVTTVAAADVPSGRQAAVETLVAAGVSRIAAQEGIRMLAALADSLRGAMLLCAASGCRLDDSGSRGIRVSRLDATDGRALSGALARLGLANDHVREALVLAAKVAAGPGMVAELCWSDDPEYTAGYVASSAGYFRFPQLKEYGNPVGGRVFFVEPATDIELLTGYLERQPVLVTIPEGSIGDE